MAQFTCCGMIFTTEEAYLEHRGTVHGERRESKHTCCGMNFYTDEAYLEHRAKVHGETRHERTQPGAGTG